MHFNYYRLFTSTLVFRTLVPPDPTLHLASTVLSTERPTISKYLISLSNDISFLMNHEKPVLRLNIHYSECLTTNLPDVKRTTKMAV